MIRARHVAGCVAIAVTAGAIDAAVAGAADAPFSSASRAIQVSALSGYHGGDASRAVLALGPPDRVLAVYRGANRAVTARMLDSSGRPSRQQVVLWAGPVADALAVGWVASSHRFLVTWSTTSARPGRIMVRAVSVTGQPLGPARRVSSSRGAPYAPALVAGPDDRVLVAWADVCDRRCGSATVGRVRGRVLDSLGRPVSLPLIVARTSGISQPVGVLRGGPHAFRVVWTTSYAVFSREEGAFTRAVTTTGSPAGSPTTLLHSQSINSGTFAFAAAGRAGGYVAIYPSSADQTGLDAKRFSAGMRPIGRPVKIVDVRSYAQIGSPESIVCSQIRRRCLAAWTTQPFVDSLPDGPAPPDQVQGALLDLSRRTPTPGPAALLADASADPADGASDSALLELGHGRTMIAWLGAAAPRPAASTPDREIFTRILHDPQ